MTGTERQEQPEKSGTCRHRTKCLSWCSSHLRVLVDHHLPSNFYCSHGPVCIRNCCWLQCYATRVAVYSSHIFSFLEIIIALDTKSRVTNRLCARNALCTQQEEDRSRKKRHRKTIISDAIERKAAMKLCKSHFSQWSTETHEVFLRSSIGKWIVKPVRVWNFACSRHRLRSPAEIFSRWQRRRRSRSLATALARFIDVRCRLWSTGWTDLPLRHFLHWLNIFIFVV